MPNVAIVIPAVLPARAVSLFPLVEKLLIAVPWPILVSVQGADETSRINHDRAWTMGFHASVKWTLLIQDDVILSPEFGARVPEMLDATGADAVTFYSDRKGDIEAWREGRTERTMAPSSYCMEQCLAVRSGLVREFIAFAPSWYVAHPEHIHTHDLAVAAFLSREHCALIACIPSQVQHLDYDSLLGHHGKPRRSRSYEAAYA